jgi:hypothetical protein
MFVSPVVDMSWFVNSDIFRNVPVVDMFWFVNSDIFTNVPVLIGPGLWTIKSISTKIEEI